MRAWLGSQRDWLRVQRLPARSVGPLLAGLAWHLVVLRPSLSMTLARSRSQAKRVLEEHTRIQHQRTGGWSANVQIDSTDLSVERTLEIINTHLGSDPHLVGEV